MEAVKRLISDSSETEKLTIRYKHSVSGTDVESDPINVILTKGSDKAFSAQLYAKRYESGEDTIYGNLVNIFFTPEMTVEAGESIYQDSATEDGRFIRTITTVRKYTWKVLRVTR